MRQMRDCSAASATGTIVPGKRGAKATCPFPRAENSVMKKLPPLNERFSPAKNPPPVWVFISIVSFIQHMQLVWL